MSTGRVLRSGKHTVEAVPSSDENDLDQPIPKRQKLGNIGSRVAEEESARKRPNYREARVYRRTAALLNENDEEVDGEEEEDGDGEDDNDGGLAFNAELVGVAMNEARNSTGNRTGADNHDAPGTGFDAGSAKKRRGRPPKVSIIKPTLYVTQRSQKQSTSYGAATQSVWDPLSSSPPSSPPPPPPPPEPRRQPSENASAGPANATNRPAQNQQRAHTEQAPIGQEDVQDDESLVSEFSEASEDEEDVVILPDNSEQAPAGQEDVQDGEALVSESSEASEDEDDVVILPGNAEDSAFIDAPSADEELKSVEQFVRLGGMETDLGHVAWSGQGRNWPVSFTDAPQVKRCKTATGRTLLKQIEGLEGLCRDACTARDEPHEGDNHQDAMHDYLRHKNGTVKTHFAHINNLVNTVCGEQLAPPPPGEELAGRNIKERKRLLRDISKRILPMLFLLIRQTCLLGEYDERQGGLRIQFTTHQLHFVLRTIGWASRLEKTLARGLQCHPFESEFKKPEAELDKDEAGLKRRKEKSRSGFRKRLKKLQSSVKTAEWKFENEAIAVDKKRRQAERDRRQGEAGLRAEEQRARKEEEQKRKDMEQLHAAARSIQENKARDPLHELWKRDVHARKAAWTASQKPGPPPVKEDPHKHYFEQYFNVKPKAELITAKERANGQRQKDLERYHAAGRSTQAFRQAPDPLKQKWERDEKARKDRRKVASSSQQSFRPQPVSNNDPLANAKSKAAAPPRHQERRWQEKEKEHVLSWARTDRSVQFMAEKLGRPEPEVAELVDKWKRKMRHECRDRSIVVPRWAKK